MSKLLPVEPSMLKWGRKLSCLYRFSRAGSTDVTATWMPCAKVGKQEAIGPKCRTQESLRSNYFKPPEHCKSDDELSKLDRMRALGIPRCTPSFVLDKKCDGVLNDPCKWDRMDALHYKPSRSLDREFDKYWVECVYQKRPQRRCKKMPLVVCRRGKRKSRCGTGGNISKCKVLLGMSCHKLSDTSASTSDCMKFPLCECPRVAKNIKCRMLSKPSKCQRRLTRYPSFSECLLDKFAPIKLTECKCLEGVSMCEVWKNFKNFRRPC